MFKSGTLKSGTPECTPKIESGAGAALILEIGSGEGAALNIFGSMVMSSTLTFSLHSNVFFHASEKVVSNICMKNLNLNFLLFCKVTCSG